MKKLIVLILAMAFIYIMPAQTYAQTEGTYATMKSSITGFPLDTVTNAGTRSQILRVPGYNNAIVIVGTITKISGTLGGTIKLYGSLDGTNYVQIDTTAYTVTDVATQSYTWFEKPSGYTYYKVSYTGVTGPMAAKFANGLLRR